MDSHPSTHGDAAQTVSEYTTMSMSPSKNKTTVYGSLCLDCWFGWDQSPWRHKITWIVLTTKKPCGLWLVTMVIPCDLVVVKLCLYISYGAKFWGPQLPQMKLQLRINIAISENSTCSRQLMRCSQNLSLLGESWSIVIVLFRSLTYVYPVCTTEFTKYM